MSRIALKYIACMLLISVVLSGLAAGQASSKGKTLTIKGTVVAVDAMHSLLGCYHVCGMRLIVRLDNNSQFAVVHIEYMDDRGFNQPGPHAKLLDQSKSWAFKASMDDSQKSVVEKYVKLQGVSAADKSQIEAWRLLKGAENEVLPFGKELLIYFVKVGKFKPLSK